MPRYLEVVNAAGETATKILALREGASQGRSVRVTTHGGRTASVDWSPYSVTLNMPSLPPDAVLTRAEADRLVAFIGHECCHVLHSDRGVWNRAVAAGSRVRDWTNALEDVRIEAKEIGIGQFPALRDLLESMTGRLHYESVVEARKTGRVIGAAVSDAPYAACILGRIANGYDIPAASTLGAGLSVDVTALVDRALAGISTCKSTGDVLALARSLVDAEAQLPDDQGQGQGDQGQGQGDQGQGQGDQGQGDQGQGDQGQGQGDQGQGDQGQGDQGQGDQGQGDQGQGDQGQGDQGQGDQGQGQGDQGQGQGQGDQGQGQGQGDQGQGDQGQGDQGQGQGQGNSQAQPGTGSGPATDANITGMVDAIATRAGIDDLEKYALTDKSHRLSVAATRVIDGPRPYPDENSLTADNLARRLPANAVLAGQIGRLLVSDEVRRVTHHESSGRLDRRALVRLQAGASDVYSRRDDTPGIDTALLVLIDGSASMRAQTGRYDTGPTRMHLAQTAAYHIARAAEMANAKVAVGVFYSNDSGVTGAKVVMIKPWHLPLASCAARLAGIVGQAQTPLSPAILAGGRLLTEVNATRRILMCLTDGECDYGNAGVTKACTIVADGGVETVGIGMACASVTAAFPPRYSVNVEDLAQLATKGLGVLCTMLEDANPRGAD